MPDVFNSRGYFAPEPVAPLGYLPPTARCSGTTGDSMADGEEYRYDVVWPMESMRQCRQCRTILMPLAEDEAWGDDAYIRWSRAVRAAEAAGEDPDAIPLPGRYHVLTFYRLPDPFERAEQEAAFTRETAQDGPGDEPEPDAPPSAEPPRPVPPEYTPEAIEAPRRQGVEENREDRYRDRVARGIPTTNIRQTKSKLGRTSEYRRIEGRRYRARKNGLDPDFLGPKFRLPRRESAGERMDYKRLVRNGLRAGLITPTDIED